MGFNILQPRVFKKSASCLKVFCNIIFKETGRRWSSKYFITTPIFYVNAEPHIGHLYTAVIADAANRFQKLKNPIIKTKFMVGTDEHGLKVSQSANELKIDVKAYCDKISDRYKFMFELFNIQYDDFVRTTEERHEKAAVALWNKIFSKNLIYADSFSGWYCIADEMFVAEHFLDPNIEKNGFRYTLDGKAVQFTEEVNYKFKLSNFHDDILYWLKGDIVRPSLFQSELIKRIEETKGLNDISVSRPAKRVPWGIPVPGDPSQTIYVWMDALSSYLCANGYPESNFKWPPDVQVIGKDILKFHGIFWPAFLMAADLEPPRSLYCHSHWLKNDEKMSKSKGNVVNPLESSKKYTSDGLRYFLLRGGVPHSDGNFSEKKVTAYLNSELGDTLGNLLLRCTAKTLNPGQIFPTLFEGYRKYFDDACENLIKNVENLPETVINYFEDFSFYKGIDAIFAVLHATNKFFQLREPWNSKINDVNRIILTLHLTMETLRVCGILLQPIVPSTSDKLLTKLSISVNKRSLLDIRPFSWEFQELSQTQNISLMTERSEGQNLISMISITSFEQQQQPLKMPMDVKIGETSDSNFKIRRPQRTRRNNPTNSDDKSVKRVV